MFFDVSVDGSPSTAVRAHPDFVEIPGDPGRNILSGHTRKIVNNGSVRSKIRTGDPDNVAREGATYWGTGVND